VEDSAATVRIICILLIASQLLILLFHVPTDDHDASHLHPLPRRGDPYAHDSKASGGTLPIPNTRLKIRDYQEMIIPASESVDKNNKSPILWSNDGLLSLVPKTTTSMENPLSSVVHCVGDNFLPNSAWMYRSCQYRNVCYNTQQKEFVVYPSSSQKDLGTVVQKWQNSKDTLGFRRVRVPAAPTKRKSMHSVFQHRRRLLLPTIMNCPTTTPATTLFGFLVPSRNGRHP
jgi:hypothetical protein